VERLPSLAQRCGTEHHQNLAAIHHLRCPFARAPLLKLFYKESDSNERLRVSNWIVQRLYDDAVKKTVEF
jgi:hypothetical protein